MTVLLNWVRPSVGDFWAYWKVNSSTALLKMCIKTDDKGISQQKMRTGSPLPLPHTSIQEADLVDPSWKTFLSFIWQRCWMFCQFPRKLVGKTELLLLRRRCPSQQAPALSGLTHALINCVTAGRSHNLSGYQLPYFGNGNVHSSPTCLMWLLWGVKWHNL